MHNKYSLQVAYLAHMTPEEKKKYNAEYYRRNKEYWREYYGYTKGDIKTAYDTHRQNVSAGYDAWRTGYKNTLAEMKRAKQKGYVDKMNINYDFNNPGNTSITTYQGKYTPADYRADKKLVKNNMRQHLRNALDAEKAAAKRDTKSIIESTKAKMEELKYGSSGNYIYDKQVREAGIKEGKRIIRQARLGYLKTSISLAFKKLKTYGFSPF